MFKAKTLFKYLFNYILIYVYFVLYVADIINETSTSSGFVSLPNIEKYKSEAARLATFDAWTYPQPAPKDLAKYSSVPNRRVGQNKRAGGKILRKH